MSSLKTDIVELLKKYTHFAILQIYIDESQPELVELYKTHIEAHNKATLSDDFANSGFDLFIPNDVDFSIPFKTEFVNLGVKCEMFIHDSIFHITRNCAYNMFPRSSMSKTPLMLANHTGIIDSGYRGYLISALRYLPETQNAYKLLKNTKLLQVCHPSLCPIYITIVTEEDLSKTTRGDGAFGSTGI
jgi:dUTP pyrophosphatase